MRIKEWLQKVPHDAWYIALLLVASRLALTLISVASRYLQSNSWTAKTQYIGNIFLDVWGQWDTARYIQIATHGYNEPITYAWFPFYALLIRDVNYVINNPFIAGLIVSNAALVVACIYLYKYVRLHADSDTAFRSVKYMILWPSAFVLSGVFTESTFLALLIVAFYYAEKRKWVIVGILGYCAALTRLVGVALFIPLLYEYFHQRGFNLREVKANIIALLFIPLGTATYLFYCYVTSGDWLAYMHRQFLLGPPFERGFGNFTSQLRIAAGGGVQEIVWLAFALAAIAILVVYARRFRLSHWLLCASLLFLPLSTGIAGTNRYTLVLFPLFMLFGELSKDDTVDMLLTISFALLQGCFIIFWAWPMMA